MKVDKSMINKELLRPYYPLKAISWLMTKQWGINLLNRLSRFSEGKTLETLECEERYIPSRHEGPAIRVRIFKPKAATGQLPGLFYVHGGGYILANPESALSEIERYIHQRPCVVIAPAYRLASKHPFPAGFNDCYDTLLWMRDNAESLGIKGGKFIIAGHSAGGGMTAALTLKARETQDIEFAFQLPIYPMIDYRQQSESATNNNAIGWSSQNNQVAWGLYLKNVQSKKPKEAPTEVPIYASPSLNTDYANLPPTITFVGDLEPFRDEVIEYVENLKAAGVPVKFKLFKGAYHAFEFFCPQSAISKSAIQFHSEAFAEYYDRYIGK